MLPINLLKLLRKYFLEYNPENYLFEGQNSPKYSASSIRKVLSRSVEKAGVTKHIKVHSLRHSFATHLLENGTDVRIIQKLLGHNSLNTTMIYTQVANSTITKIKSPLDLLNKEDIHKKQCECIFAFIAICWSCKITHSCPLFQ